MLRQYLYKVPLTTKPLGPEFSPIDLITPQWPPTFVMIATKDKLIDPKQSYNFVDKLKHNGVEVEIGEADMEHGRSEVDWEGSTESKGNYERWFRSAIRPGLDFMIAHLRKE